MWDFDFNKRTIFLRGLNQKMRVHNAEYRNVCKITHNTTR